MFGMRHFGSREDRHAVGRHGHWGRHHRHGMGGGRHGRGGDFGGGDMKRIGRMLAQGDLRLLALALIAEQPRHGYEIIKVLEDKTGGWYAPSPGIVYPTLTYLEEAGYVTAQADGTKKLYTITSEGRVYLEQNRAFVDAVLERLAAVGERAGRMRDRERGETVEHRGDASMPRSIQGAFQDLSEVVREVLSRDRNAKSRVIEALDRAAEELRKS
jgi:DNA-binding PadR family transcriptional regulator